MAWNEHIAENKSKEEEEINLKGVLVPRLTGKSQIEGHSYSSWMSNNLKNPGSFQTEFFEENVTVRPRPNKRDGVLGAES